METLVMDLFSGIYFGKKILITGHTGFKGSWLSTWLTALGAEVYGYALAPQSVKDNFIQTDLKAHLSHFEGDVRDLEKLHTRFNQVKPDFAFHLASQPLVLQSLQNPHYTFETNLMGTVNFFEAVRLCPSVKAAINITSDKCYQNNKNIGFKETDALGGNDPYSASKASSELITNSYLHSFFSTENTSAVASARAGNVIGGGDWAKHRIVPDIFRAYLDGKPLQIRNPEAIRPWQFVLEPLAGYLKLGQKLYTEGKDFTGAWNFGPANSHNVIDVVNSIKKHIPELNTILEPEQNVFAEANVLKLDSTRAYRLLGWKPRMDFESAIQATVQGYYDEFYFNGEALFKKRITQINHYCN